MKGTKIGVLFLIAIMSVAGVGASYAAWTQSVDIYTSATTGTFDFRIYNIVVNNPNGATITPVYYDDHTWGVTVTDTYPGWKGWITVTHQNAGTVPLKFNSFQVLSLAGDSGLFDKYTLKFYPGAYASPGTANIYGNLYDFQTLQPYDAWIWPYEIKMAKGTYHDSLVSLELDASVTDHYLSSVTFIFEMTAIQTTI
jgi:hypothetical protein